MHLLHFDYNGVVKQYLRQLPKLAARTRYLRSGYNMSNVLNPMLQPKKSSHGVYEIYWPNVTLDTALTAVSPENDTGVFVKELIRNEPWEDSTAEPGTMLLVEGDPMTVEPFLQVLSAVAGERSRLAPVDPEDFVKLVYSKMPIFGNEFAGNFRYYRDSGYSGRDEDVKRVADFDIEDWQLTSYRRYLEGLSREALGPVP